MVPRKIASQLLSARPEAERLVKPEVFAAEIENQAGEGEKDQAEQEPAEAAGDQFRARSVAGWQRLGHGR